MRAQQHEFSNRMHAIAGLLELGRSGEALDYIHEIRGGSADFDQNLRTRIAAPQIVGLILGKAAEAHERGIEFMLSPESSLGRLPISSVADDDPGQPRRQRIRRARRACDRHDAVDGERGRDGSSRSPWSVSDNGPGLPHGAISQIFTNGYTTKRGSLVRHGLGLSLVTSRSPS